MEVKTKRSVSEFNTELKLRGYNVFQILKYEQGVKIYSRKAEKVTFERLNDKDLNMKIDEAYQIKYNSSEYLKSMIGSRTKAAIVQIRVAE